MATLRNLRILTATLVVACVLGVHGTAHGQTSASRVRILLVADTQGFDAERHGFAKDVANLADALKVALRELGLEDSYTLDTLDGADATPAKILEYYRTLKTDRTESLFFYYSGHGGTEAGKGHFLALKAGKVYRDELRAAMQAQHPRLVVLLTDCCADGVAFSPGDAAKVEKAALASLPQTAHRRPAGEVVKHMLFDQRGLVDINACETGKGAGSVNFTGGHFTLALVKLLNAPSNQFKTGAEKVVHWNTFFVVLQNETMQSVANAKGVPQVPVAFLVTTEVQTSTANVVEVAATK